MPTSVGIRVVGNTLVESFDDGSHRTFVPSAGGVYLRVANTGVAQGAGGGEQQTTPATGGTAGTSAAPVDDYPYPNAPLNSFSPFRYVYRDCTDFSAWRINRDLGRTSAPWMYTWGQLRLTNGDAIGWRDDWQTHGWGVSSTPTAGMLGWYGSKAGAYGHVNYVQQVASNGTIHLEEYNWGDHRHAYNQRDESPGSAYYPDAFLAMPPKR